MRFQGVADAVAEALWIFEGSADDEIDSRVAVRAMESMASRLLEMPAAELDELCAYYRAFGDPNAEYAEFVHQIPAMLGVE